MSLPTSLLAPDLEPFKPAAVDPTSRPQKTKPRPQQPNAPPSQPDYGGINFSMTDNFCLEANVSACEAMTDLCAALPALGSSSPWQQNLCQGVQTFCEKQQQMGDHVHLDLSAKICLNLEASAKACEIVAEVCRPGSKAAGSLFCQRSQAYCAAR
jgi:hypothetical protein